MKPMLHKSITKFPSLVMGASLALTVAMVSGCYYYIDDDDDDYYYDETPDDVVMEPGAACNPDPDNCMLGCYCAEDASSGTYFCEETGFCTVDEDCGVGMECDEDRDTCVPADPDLPPPTCVEDPAVCGADQVCDTEGDEPVCRDAICDDRTDIDSCTADENCSNVFTGLNCTDPTGADCTEGSSNCVCESFVWADCIDTPVEP